MSSYGSRDLSVTVAHFFGAIFNDHLVLTPILLDAAIVLDNTEREIFFFGAGQYVSGSSHAKVTAFMNS